MSEMTHLMPLPDVDYSRFRFRSTLHLSNLSHADAGLYTCKVISRRHADLAERVFLFVRDLEHPAAAPAEPAQSENGSEPATVALELSPQRSSYIPCRPAHPEFYVQLLREGVDVSRRFEYRPDVGFGVASGGGLVPADVSGDYECLFSSLHVFEASLPLRVEAYAGKKFGILRGGVGGRGIGVAGAEGGDGGGGGRGNGATGRCTSHVMTIILVSVIFLME